MSGNDVQRSVKRGRALRAAAVFAVALNAFFLAVDIAAGSALAFAPVIPMIALLLLIVMQTRLIGTMERTREPNRHAGRLEIAEKAMAAAVARCFHPAAEPVALLLTGERVAWVCPDCSAGLPAGWAPPAQVTGTLTASGGALSATAALSGTGTLSAPMTGPGGRWRPLSELPGMRQEDGGIPAGPLIEGMRRELEAHAPRYADALTDGEVKDATEAAVHFAQLARVGLESCIGFCPICAERHDPRGGSGRVTVVYHSGGVIAGGGGGGGTSASVRHLEPPEGAHGYRLDSAGREWCRDADGMCWIKPGPDGPWYRQNKPDGGER